MPMMRFSTWLAEASQPDHSLDKLTGLIKQSWLGAGGTYDSGSGYLKLPAKEFSNHPVMQQVGFAFNVGEDGSNSKNTREGQLVTTHIDINLEWLAKAHEEAQIHNAIIRINQSVVHEVRHIINTGANGYGQELDSMLKYYETSGEMDSHAYQFADMYHTLVKFALKKEKKETDPAKTKTLSDLLNKPLDWQYFYAMVHKRWGDSTYDQGNLRKWFILYMPEQSQRYKDNPDQQARWSRLREGMKRLTEQHFEKIKNGTNSVRSTPISNPSIKNPVSESAIMRAGEWIKERLEEVGQLLLGKTLPVKQVQPQEQPKAENPTQPANPASGVTDKLTDYANTLKAAGYKVYDFGTEGNLELFYVGPTENSAKDRNGNKLGFKIVHSTKDGKWYWVDRAVGGMNPVTQKMSTVMGAPVS